LTATVQAGLVFVENDTCRLSKRGAEVVEVTERTLPVALRRAVAEACAGVRDRQLRARCVNAAVDAVDGEVFFTGSLSDGISTLLELRLHAGSEKQANVFKTRFLKNAEQLMVTLWEELSGKNLAIDGKE